ncbi:GTP 3',8-cyclase MoaA [Aeromicrobium sp. Marseille-Q0843]|uniref:GTP 3',8-cyclase n=1 Tax=Aeromicrobium phoceense TaxID=2754045 RepID=A0A838XHH4_9ACTN|nr:GTP 3',8-cyclase MoaA [Aeromicrobium phoceense]
MTLVDGFGRVHRDLRISLTDKCSLRCTYCMPAEGVPWIERDSILTTDELERIARICVGLGVTSIRLTGGEPLVRKDAVEVVRRLAALGPEVSMTTNGLRLAELAQPLREAGLARLNISIDTLDRERFAQLTRRDRLDDVLAGIEAARVAGFTPLKLNAVAMRGVNEDELVDLVEYAVGQGAQLRFIEQMPLDAGHTWDRAAMLTGDEILERLRTRYELESIPGRGSSPADTWLLDGGPGSVGVIASVTAPFCAACDRIRITADGHVRNCLFARDESDLVKVLRGGGSDEDLVRIISGSIAAKRAGHGIDSPTFVQPDRPMSAIGG